MDTWGDIDAKLAAHKQALARVKEEAKLLGGGHVRADGLGWWTCSYRPTSGVRLAQRLRARSPDELLSKLREAVGAPRPPAGG